MFKFIDDQGSYLASLITYYGFVSLFPLLLILTSILGFVLQGHADLQQEILRSTLSQFPVIGDQLRAPMGLRGSGAGLAVGATTALYGALGVAQAIQNAMNLAWGVPRYRRPNPIKARLRSLTLIGTAGIAIIATTLLTAIVANAASFGADVSLIVRVVAPLLAVAVNVAIFALVFRVSTASPLTLRDALPGAFVAATIWQGLQLLGSVYVVHLIRGSEPTYGVFALVLGMLGWIYLAAVGLVLGVEVNVVRVKHLYPRALLTPVTDDVDLTAGDKRAYRDAAGAQQFKAFESVDVTFEDDGQHATATRARRENPPDGH